MKSILVWALLVCSFLFSVDAYATNNLTAAGTIDKMNAMTFSLFEVHGEFSDPENCGSSQKIIVGYHAVDTDASRESKYSMAMAALMSGKKVQFWVDGCVGSFPVAKDMEMLR
jgi:hypothetical protein